MCIPACSLRNEPLVIKRGLAAPSVGSSFLRMALQVLLLGFCVVCWLCSQQRTTSADRQPATCRLELIAGGRKCR